MSIGSGMEMDLEKTHLSGTNATREGVAPEKQARGLNSNSPIQDQ